MRDIVFFLVFGAFVWAAAVVGFVSIYLYAGDSIQCVALNDQDACIVRPSKLKMIAGAEPEFQHISAP
jgi:hypothetical protein